MFMIALKIPRSGTITKTSLQSGQYSIKHNRNVTTNDVYVLRLLIRDCATLLTKMTRCDFVHGTSNRSEYGVATNIIEEEIRGMSRVEQSPNISNMKPFEFGAITSLPRSSLRGSHIGSHSDPRRTTHRRRRRPHRTTRDTTGSNIKPSSITTIRVDESLIMPQTIDKRAHAGKLKVKQGREYHLLIIARRTRLSDRCTRAMMGSNERAQITAMNHSVALRRYDLLHRISVR
jgi:hypothetical protein